MELKKKENIGWIDLLRILACFLVVFSHCCDPFVAQFDNDRTSFLTGVWMGSLVRPCVPLFVMMTGVLLFPIRISLGDFYRKRIGRILIPLVFWSVVLPLLFFGYLHFINPASHNPAIPADTHTWADTVNKIYTFIFNFNFDTTPLWYLYMLIGLYLVMPVFSCWMEQASAKDMRKILYVWGISLVLPYLKMVAPVLGYTGNYGNMGIWGVCDWNPYGSLYYFSGFIGYLVLAHYLVKYPLAWSWKKTWAILLPLFITGYLITAGGFILTQEYFPGNYANLEIIWYFSGINVFMMTFPLFVIIQKTNIASSPLLRRVASATFGIYLCHFLFVQIAYDVFETEVLPIPVRMLCAACSAFLVSYLLTKALAAFPLTRRTVM